MKDCTNCTKCEELKIELLTNCDSVFDAISDFEIFKQNCKNSEN